MATRITLAFGRLAVAHGLVLRARDARLLDEALTNETYDVVAVEDNSMGVYRLLGDVPAILTEHEVRRSRSVAAPPLRPDRWKDWVFEETDWRRWRGYLPRVWQPFDVLQVFGQRDADLVKQMSPTLVETRPRQSLRRKSASTPTARTGRDQ